VTESGQCLCLNFPDSHLRPDHYHISMSRNHHSHRKSDTMEGVQHSYDNEPPEGREKPAQTTPTDGQSQQGWNELGTYRTQAPDPGDWESTTNGHIIAHLGPDRCVPCMGFLDHIQDAYFENDSSFNEALAYQMELWKGRILEDPNVHNWYAAMYPSRRERGTTRAHRLGTDVNTIKIQEDLARVRGERDALAKKVKTLEVIIEDYKARYHKEASSRKEEIADLKNDIASLKGKMIDPPPTHPPTYPYYHHHPGPRLFRGPPMKQPIPPAPRSHVPPSPRMAKPNNIGPVFSWYDDEEMDTSDGAPSPQPAMAPPPGLTTSQSQATNGIETQVLKRKAPHDGSNNGRQTPGEQRAAQTYVYPQRPRLTSSPLWEELLRSIPGEQTRQKVDQYIVEYWREDTDRLKEELRDLGPHRTPDQDYLLDSLKNDKRPFRQWLKDPTCKPFGIDVKNRVFPLEHINIYNNFKNIFARDSYAKHLDTIQRALDLSRWPENNKQSEGMVDIPLPPGAQFNDAAITKHLQQECHWTRTFVQKKARPFIIRAYREKFPQPPKPTTRSRTASAVQPNLTYARITRGAAKLASAEGSSQPQSSRADNSEVDVPSSPKRQRTDDHEGLSSPPQDNPSADSSESADITMAEPTNEEPSGEDEVPAAIIDVTGSDAPSGSSE
jgi:hypothetical protein